MASHASDKVSYYFRASKISRKGEQSGLTIITTHFITWIAPIVGQSFPITNNGIVNKNKINIARLSFLDVVITKL